MSTQRNVNDCPQASQLPVVDADVVGALTTTTDPAGGGRDWGGSSSRFFLSHHTFRCPLIRREHTFAGSLKFPICNCR